MYFSVCFTSFPISATNNDEVEISGDRTKEKKIELLGEKLDFLYNFVS